MFSAATYAHAIVMNADSCRYVSHAEAFMSHSWAMFMVAYESTQPSEGD